MCHKNAHSWIRIRISGYGSGFWIQPIFDTDPDPGKLYGFLGSGSASAKLGVSKFRLNIEGVSETEITHAQRWGSGEEGGGGAKPTT